MPAVYFKLIPVVISVGLFIAAFRIHEQYWSHGFIGWKWIYLGLIAFFLGSLAGVFFEFAELRQWQNALGWPIDWIALGVGASLGIGLVLCGAVQRLTMAAREQEELAARQEAFNLFDAIREAALGPYSLVEILNFSLREIIRKIGADAGGIWLLHPSGKEYILASASGFALSLQQKLERVPAGHAGFSRAANDSSPREISDVSTLQRLFPELTASGGGYAAVFTVPLQSGHGPLQERKPTGLLICCSQVRGILSPADGKLIGSAVALLSAIISEVHTSRALRNERRSRELLIAPYKEFSVWLSSWSAETKPEHKLQVAVAGLGTHVGEFIGCGRYFPEDNRWEPLALTAGESKMALLGSDGFRAAAVQAVKTGRETAHLPAQAEGVAGASGAYRMVPVMCPAGTDQRHAVLFVPRLNTPPKWWNDAVQILVELTRGVLLVRQIEEEMQTVPNAGGEELPGLHQLVEYALNNRPEGMPQVVAEVLPDGWRAAFWQSLPAGDSYHLRFAATAKGATVYHSFSALASAPTADDLELHAHLGGLVRIDYKGPGVLSDLWPDFGSGWCALRFPVPPAEHNRGWLSIYHPFGADEPSKNQQLLFNILVRLLDLVLARWDMESPDYQQEYEKRSLVAPRRRPDNVTIDRAITDWIAAQPQNIRPGRIDLTPPGGDVPVVYPRMIDEILDWGAANFINGMQHEQILRVNALVDRNRISIVFDRPSPADGLNDLELHQPAAALPLKQSVRDTLDRWDGRSRVINSADGPRKLMLSFTVREKHPSPTTMAKAACVLVVNEEELIRDLLVAMLDVLGYQAVAASSVEQGLALLVAGDFKLIIAGQDLPGGVDFARQARAHRADALIIALGEPARTEPEAGTAGWSDTTLTTPFRIDDLRAILETARN